jgi:hypothetical protein
MATPTAIRDDSTSLHFSSEPASPRGDSLAPEEMVSTSAPLAPSYREKITNRVSTAYEGAKTWLASTAVGKTYQAQEEANERLTGSSSSGDRLDQVRARVGGNSPILAAATTLFVKTPTQFFHDKVLKKNPLSDTEFRDLQWGPTSFLPSLIKATMKFVSSPLKSLGCDKCEKLQDWLNNKVQAGDTYKITKVAAVIGHGVFTALKIGRVALAVFAAIGVTAATIGIVTGIALTALGLAAGTSIIWMPFLLCYLVKKVNDLEQRLNKTTSVNPDVIAHAKSVLPDDGRAGGGAGVVVGHVNSGTEV